MPAALRHKDGDWHPLNFPMLFGRFQDRPAQAASDHVHLMPTRSEGVGARLRLDLASTNRILEISCALIVSRKLPSNDPKKSFSQALLDYFTLFMLKNNQISRLVIQDPTKP